MSTRKHDIPISIKTTPDELWKAISEADGIKSWFAPEVRVVPGEGGSMWISWGEGAEGESKIVAWEPGRRLSTSFGNQTVDYIIESNGAETVLRLVHSGFGADATFDNEYESTRGGWITFLNMLKHGLERHPGVSAENISVMRQTKVPPAEAWQRIEATGELAKGRAVPGDPAGFRRGFVLPELNDAYLAVFCEGKDAAMVTITCILYGLPAAQAAAARAKWEGLLNGLFPKEAQASVPA